MSHPIWIEEPSPVTTYRSGMLPGYRVTTLVRSQPSQTFSIDDNSRRALST